MQIRARLTLQFTLVITLIVLFAFSIIYFSSSNYRQTDFFHRLRNKARTSAEIFISVEQIDSTMLRIFDDSQKDRLPYENISIYDHNNVEVYTNNDSIRLDPSHELLDEIRRAGLKEFRKQGHEVVGITYNDKFNRFVVLASANDQYGFKKLHNLRNTLVLLLFIIISISAIAGWMFAGRALKPLKDIVNEVQGLNIDRLDSRLRESRYNDEIGRLIHTFNILLERIENAFELQKLFVSGASHELKNPLTTITSQLQVVLLKERSADEYRTIITSILEDIKSLNKTTLDLMEYARLNYEKEIQLTEVRIDDVLWFCKDLFSRANPQYKVNINFLNMPEDEKKLIIPGNEALLKIAFINLIDNGCKFSPNNSCDVNLSVSDGELRLDFTDSGIGLSPEEINLVFEPFYRANKTAEVKGHGLGLPLTKKIVQLHGGEIRVTSVKGIGTTFSLQFRSKF